MKSPVLTIRKKSSLTNSYFDSKMKPVHRLETVLTNRAPSLPYRPGASEFALQNSGGEGWGEIHGYNKI